MCGCAYWEFVFMFFGYSAEKLSFPAVESFNQSITLSDQTCLEFDSILLEHKERTESDHITSAWQVCISVSVCLCCTCMCCTIFLSCTRNSLASVARSDRTFSAWESCPWKDKDRSRDVRRYRKYRQRASELYLTNFTKACSTKDKNLTALSLENKQF